VTISVFLADDHTVLRDGLQFLLEAEPDIKVVGDAADGRTAVQKVIQLCPDVVVMDIVMPELNGIEATHKIHKACPAVKVIILSMHGSNEHVLRALQAGARGFLLKGSAGNEVVAAVRAVYAGHTYLSQKISDQVVGEYSRLGDLDEERTPLSRLSPREREVLQLVVEGKSSAEIANILAISLNTVDTYRSRLMQKLDIRDLPSLVKFAIQQGLTPLE
jgi:DNA-binding NarL/FixJ family response regulator